jgi:hypothetical protein
MQDPAGPYCTRPECLETHQHTISNRICRLSNLQKNINQATATIGYGFRPLQRKPFRNGASLAYHKLTAIVALHFCRQSGVSRWLRKQAYSTLALEKP